MICDTAIVKNSDVGEGTKIWEFVNIYGCSIGCNCNIGSYVEIQSGVTIGDKVVVSSHSFICSLVTIEDDVFIGHGVMTINDVNPPSFRRTGTKEYWQKTLIKKGAVIGSNATLFPVVIGKNAVIGAGAVVTKNVPDGCTVMGNPAIIVVSD
ncbi:MAG: acyltransferase [Candidatus Theseobacter exili]|nr:acyltransferase [Candidatus Theseobacter exili]